MNKIEFIDLTGENPEDMFGGDWQNEVDSILNKNMPEVCYMCEKISDGGDYDNMCHKCQETFDKRLMLV